MMKMIVDMKVTISRMICCKAAHVADEDDVNNDDGDDDSDDYEGDDFKNDLLQSQRQR